MIVDPGSVEALKLARDAVLRDPAQRQTLAQSGRRTIEEHCSFVAGMDKIKHIYDLTFTGAESTLAPATDGSPPR